MVNMERYKNSWKKRNTEVKALGELILKRRLKLKYNKSKIKVRKENTKQKKVSKKSGK